jgi:mono/diheme cytochrome c family protein
LATFNGVHEQGATAAVRRTGPRRAMLGVLAATLLLAPGCTRIDNALASVPIFAFMRDAPSFGPYEHPLPPPPGSVPFQTANGEMLPPLEASEAAFAAFEASPWGQNPLAADDPAALELGQLMYERHCSVCHGVTGAGDGPVAAAYPPGFVLPVNSGAALGRSDAYMYAVVRAGRGRMPAYGARMTHIERWAVVTYVNTLQGAGGAAPQGAAPAATDTLAAPIDTTAPAASPTDTTAPATPPTQQ